MVMQNSQLSTAQEKEKVLSQLDLKKAALRRRIKSVDLSEDDFVQFLNLETKYDLVAQASDETLQQMVDEERAQIRKNKEEDSRDADAAIVGESMGNIGEATPMAAPGIFAAVIGVPVAAAVWCWGKGKEIARTFKTSYQNDGSKNRLGKALWRSIKYPFFKIPLVNKMRQSMDFGATPKERQELQDELKDQRLKNLKKEAVSLAKYAAYPALAVGGCVALIGGMVSVETGNLAPMLSLALEAAPLGAVLGVCAYPLVKISKAINKIESKSVRGRRLIEQALNYPPVQENAQEPQADETRDDVRAQIASDKVLATMAEGNISKDEVHSFRRRSSKVEEKRKGEKKSVKPANKRKEKIR